TLKDLIDRSVARKEGKAETVNVNTSLYLAPAALDKTKDIIVKLLQTQTRVQALSNTPIWYGLYNTGALAKDAPEPVQRATSYRYLGYVPVSPDGAAYSYEPKTDEVFNRRHGSLRRPELNKSADGKPP